jgi:branched-chain amino acid transport system substrate-binding protein
VRRGVQFGKPKGRPRGRTMKLSASALAVAMLAACGGASGSNDSGGGGSSAEGDPVTLGAILPMTGAQASLGAAWKAGIELAIDTVNKNGVVDVDGKTHKFELNVLDDESTPAGAQRAVQQLLADGEKFWLGPCLSSSFQTAYGTIEGSDTQLVLTPSAASEAFLDKDTDLLFKTQASQGGGGIGKFAEFLVDKYSPKTVAILEPQNPTGELIASGLEDEFKKANVEIVYNNKHDPTTTDFTPFISAIRSKNPDLVVGPYVDSYMAPMMDQAVQVGYTDTVFANYGGSLAALGDNQDAVKNFAWQPITRAVDNSDDPMVADFRKMWKDKYGKEPGSIDYYALSFYDPVVMLGEAMKAAKSIDDPAAVGSKLYDVKDWPQQVLPVKFDDKGLAHYTFQVGTLTDGKITYEDRGTN